MTLSFTATTYTTTKGAPVWPDSGTWSFSGDDSKILKRDDEVQVGIDQIEDEKLVLSLRLYRFFSPAQILLSMKKN